MKIMCKIKKIIIIKTLLKEKHKQKTNKQTNTITTNKTLIYNRENTYKWREGEREKKIIYYIQTIKRLACLICSVNMMFTQTKRSICPWLMVPVQFFLS